MDETHEEDEDYDALLRHARAEYGPAYYQNRAQEEGIPFADLTKYTPEPEALARVPAPLARQHTVLPLKLDNQTLWIALAGPSDIAALDALRLACRCTLKPVLADPEQIRVVLAHCYAEESS